MSKKIKIIILLTFLTSLTIIFSNISLAWSPAMQQPIYPQGDGYFCRQKDGAVRFTQEDLANYYLLRFDSRDHEEYDCSCYDCEPDHLSGKSSPYLDLEMIEAQGNDDLVNIYNRLLEYTRPIPSNSEWLRWYNGNFPIPAANEWVLPSGPKFCKTPLMNVTKSTTRTNDRTAYIFSSGPEVSPVKQGFKQGNYKETVSDTADDTMRQYALWADPTYNTGNIIGANDLYTEAKEFEDFYKANIANGYKATIESNKAQVIANRSAKTYIIGPYRVFYPDDARFSYIEDIDVTANGITVQPLKVLFASKTSEKIYPSTGEEFFIEFSALATGNPTSAQVNVKFCYIQKAESIYEELEGSGEIWEVYQKRTDLTKTVTGIHTIYNSCDCSAGEGTGAIECNSCGHNHAAGTTCGETITSTENHAHTHNGMILELTSRKIGSYEAQDVAHYLSSERIWKNKIVNASIDLTIELGGYVWEDAEGGKESVSDGINNGERRIPNVTVTLSNGQTTKTNANGEYRFSGLNAMLQYSVTFTYNGQYYQPTIFADANTWGSSNWKTNSNAKDVIGERISYNAKFEKIESSPINYKGSAGYNETFTKQELLGYTLQTDGTYKKTRDAVIDDFGNLILGSSGDSTIQKMIQYVRDCMINAYTTADGAAGMYPTPSLFVIDTFQYPSMLTPKAEPLYDNAYYINLGLNPRQQSDLAVKKDVEKVTLEVNGQKHIYTYDTLENKENAENTWDISLRLSEALQGQRYYDTNYSREIYTSDYLYKVSNYKDSTGKQISQDLGKAKSDELEVYVTYKIMVRNQAMSIQARVDELVDYYDTDLQYIDERSYIEITRGNNKGKYLVKASDTSRYESVSKATRTTINGYDNLYITGLSNGAQAIDDKGNPTGTQIVDGIYLEAGQTAYVYLTFRVKKDTIDGEEWVRLDEEIESAKAIGVGKENITELNGYSTRYAKGTKVPNVGDVSFNPAGIVDRDSNPGNLNPSDVPKDGKIKYENFEDDTDKAPNIRIILNRDDNAVRVISGTVFEDERTESIEVTTTGDGIRDNKDKNLINGVTVQLVELMENGREYIWRTFENGSGTAATTKPIINGYNLVKDYTFGEKYDGQYAFKSFIPGKYIVRFIYGDTTKTVLPSGLEVEGLEKGLNTKSYNGQDYKSTTYQEGIDQSREYTWKEDSTWVNGQEIKGRDLTKISGLNSEASNNERVTVPTLNANGKLDLSLQKGYLYNISESEKRNGKEYPLVSDAKDIEKRRNEVINYSDNDVTNDIAEVLASHKSDYNTMNERNTLLNDLMQNTKMTAETGLMVIEFEYDREGTEGQTVNNTSTYKIQNLDLGLEERPKAQLAVDKEVTNVKLTLADGSILFDAKNTASNVLWRDHKAYEVGYSKVSYEGGIETKEANFMDYKLFNNIANIRELNKNKFGLIQLTMDEELMHGATIEITYKVTVTNIGEVDYKDNLFYYTGNKGSNAQVVTTRADQVIDYVANNLQFNKNNNSNWNVIEKEQINSQGLVNAKLDTQVEKFNTVIETKDLKADLAPNLYKDKQDENAKSSTSVPLVLTQLITSENDSDDLTYRNLVEIVKTSNTVGRRMEYSVVGNQNPQDKPQELDSDIAEVVRILPPFGNAGLYITIAIVTIAAVGIVIIGTIFIKKKILIK